jgi:hypothetical protein
MRCVGSIIVQFREWKGEYAGFIKARIIVKYVLGSELYVNYGWSKHKTLILRP